MYRSGLEVKHLIDQQTVINLFKYEDGNLYWKNSVGSRIKSGKIAGSIRPPQNYRYVGINKKYYGIHRLIFLYHHGYLPENVDHKDGDVFNNRIENLRECTHKQNMNNVGKNAKNTSGYKGISWYSSNKKWCAKIALADKTERKFFDEIDVANEWLKSMREINHGQFCKH